MRAALERAWYHGSPWLVLLKPFERLFQYLAGRRRHDYETGKKISWQAPVPVIVVGNISVGGVGKTPLVAALVEHFSKAGMKPGIVSRGYGAKATKYPCLVTPDSAASEVGDEPLLLARRSGCPVVIDPDRPRAARYLLENCACDLVISDDGLQHYALRRDIEIAVIDGKRGLGNGMMLPAGPLREPPERLSEVQWVVVNGGDGRLSLPVNPGQQVSMRLEASEIVKLDSGESHALQPLLGDGEVHAVAGIGNPGRFYATLKEVGYRVIEHSFADHHPFSAADLQFAEQIPIIMTEKDAVKCAAMATNDCWYLRVNAVLDNGFLEQLSVQVENARSARLD